jgi:leader peptidase (prepilin peptidase)/N-methyltransferase
MPLPVSATDVLVFVWVFLIGLAAGSFLNVCTFRLPARGMSVVRPRSHCFSCGATIRWFDNIPLVSFVLLRAKCRWCGAPISLRYPVVELLTGVVLVLTASAAAWNGAWSADWQDWARAGTGFLLYGGLLVASAVDLDRRVLPDEITIPGMFLGPAVALFAPGTFPGPLPLFAEPHLDALAGSVAGLAAGGGSVFLIGWIFRVLLRKEAMGFGDVKLLAACGSFLGWQGALVALLLACVIGAVSGIVYYLLVRSRYIPFGPFLAIAALSYWWFHPWIRHFLFVTYPAFLERVMGMPS